MNNKNLINKLSKVASIFAEDSRIECDIVVASDSICLSNWELDIVPIVAIRFILKVCKMYGLIYYVDFDSKTLVIHG